MSDAPDVYGVKGACQLLGVSRQRLDVLRKHAEFPAPALVPFPVWDGPALRAYALDRKDGRAHGVRTRQRALRSFRATHSYARAARTAGVHPDTVRAWMDAVGVGSPAP